jgi:hypothetical protein
MSQRAMSIDNISFLSPPTSNHNEQYDDDKAVSEATSDDIKEQRQMTQMNDVERHIAMTKTIMTEDEENENIIPWKKLLRKTNSRLNLIS